MPRSKPTKPTRRMKQAALKALHGAVTDDAVPPYAKIRAATALLGAARADEADTPERDPNEPRTIVFLPKKVPLPGQREDESRAEWDARVRVKSEARRAAYCEHIGEPYNPMRALPCSPWPVPGSDPALEDDVDRRVDAAEAAEIARQRAHPRPDPVVLGPREHSPDIILYDSQTPEGRADYARWRAEAVAAGHAVLAPQ